MRWFWCFAMHNNSHVEEHLVFQQVAGNPDIPQMGTRALGKWALGQSMVRKQPCLHLHYSHVVLLCANVVSMRAKRVT